MQTRQLQPPPPSRGSSLHAHARQRMLMCSASDHFAGCRAAQRRRHLRRRPPPAAGPARSPSRRPPTQRATRPCPSAAVPPRSAQWPTQRKFASAPLALARRSVGAANFGWGRRAVMCGAAWSKREGMVSQCARVRSMLHARVLCAALCATCHAVCRNEDDMPATAHPRRLRIRALARQPEEYGLSEQAPRSVHAVGELGRPHVQLRAKSRCRCGRRWPSPGADVAGAGPVLVQMWLGSAVLMQMWRGVRSDRNGAEESPKQRSSPSFASTSTSGRTPEYQVSFPLRAAPNATPPPP